MGSRPLSFHAEVRRGYRRAWAFNLSRERLEAEVLAPWREGRTLELGGKSWEPRDCELRVLEGPHLELADLSHGQGPGSAERTARDVTREVGAAGEDRSRAVAAELLAELGRLDGVVVGGDATEALDLLAERLRSLGLG